MKRDFLKNLGLEDSVIDQILDENSKDIGREKQKADNNRAELVDAQERLKTVQAELDALKKSSGDSAEIQKKLDELQAKYETDIAERDAKLADRDYFDAISKAIQEKSLKFSSKSAERAFVSALKENKLELKDGKLDGIDDFIKAQKEADPDAFAPDKPAPKIVSPTGNGGAPAAPVSRAAEIAAKMNADIYGSPNTKKE